MANNGIIVGGVIATVAIIFAVFVSFNSIADNGTGELIVTNGDYGETIGEVTGIEEVTNIQQLIILKNLKKVLYK